MMSLPKKLLARVRRTRQAAVLRGLAGMPVGSGGAGRRGTVLILVIGALALISVVTLVYFGIGQADRRGATTVQRKGNVDAAAKAVADHIADAVGNGVLAVQVDGQVQDGAGNLDPILIRTAADYPSTDPYRKSLGPPAGWPAGQERGFDPTGSYDQRWTGAGLDPRIASTPFLSDTEPGFLLDLTVDPPPPDITLNHDWFHISNLAPDGRFVNLWNLAPVFNGVRFSSFRAASSFPVTGTNPVAPDATALRPDPAQEPASYMSFELTLFDANGNPTRNLDGAVGGGPADLNTPAHWDSRQRRLFRPATGPVFYTTPPVDPVTAIINANSPGSVWYLPYQFGDADGDGMLDSRWIELVNASNPNNPLSLLPKDDRFRWFAAVRVMDLSSLVNVNTATDFREPPKSTGGGAAQSTMAGYTPADVDLRRLLAMVDSLYMYPAIGGLRGYQLLEQPLLAGPQNYLAYTPAEAGPVGKGGYLSARLTLRDLSEAVLPATQDLFTAATTPPSLYNAGLLGFRGDERTLNYLNYGGQPGGSYALVGADPSFATSARFSIADLKELLTYWTCNNTDSTSRLEQTIDGRWYDDDNQPSTNVAYGPLRSNRSDALDRRGNDNAENFAPSPTPPGLGNGAADVDVYARLAYDIRHLLTLLSGGRPLRSNIVPAPVGAALSLKNVLTPGVDEKVDAAVALRAASVPTVGTRDASALFGAYARALAPYSWLRDNADSAWNRTTRLTTMSFGKSAEMAIRIAAHMTVNLIDAADVDLKPSAFTLLLDEKDRLTMAGNAAFPWWNEGSNASGRLDLDADPADPVNSVIQPPLLLSDANDPATAAASGAINVYGVEPQPVITQVVTLLMYTDAPPGVPTNGDVDYNGQPEPGPFDPVTINGTYGSSDDAGQIIAIQLTNPFDEDIGLTEPATVPPRLPLPTDPNFSDYYIEFNDQFYKLVEVDRTTGGLNPVKLRKGESRVFYCFDRPETEIVTKWAALEARATQQELHEYVDTQLSVVQPDGTTLKPVQIKRMDKFTGTIAGFMPLTPNLFDAGTGGGTRRKVLLWRTMRTQAEAAVNQFANDMLVDSVRDPGQTNGNETLDQRLTAGDTPIGNTVAGPEGNANYDNTGFTIVSWGSLRRRADPAAANGQSPPLGGIPAYCVEAKWDSTTGTSTLTNKTDILPPTPSSLNETDFRGPINADETFWDLVDKVGVSTTGNTITLVEDIGKHPEDWASGPIGPNQDTPPRIYEKLYPVLHLNNKKFQAMVPPTGGTGAVTVSTLRLADMLLPLGLGPMQDPAVTSPTDPGAGWMTLSEALGLALNYSKPLPTDPAWGIYVPLVESISATGTVEPGLLDRGHLSLERGVPFEDLSVPPNGVLDAGDLPRWPRVPLALNVLNTFTVNGPQMGSLTQATHGLININTAPGLVLRTIPLLSPTTEPLTGATNGMWQYWRTNQGAAGAAPSVPNPASAPLANDGTDIAATIVGYRSTTALLDRDQQLVDFRSPTSVSPFNMLLQDGRFATTQISGLREAPGFSMPAEIMMLTERGPTGAPANVRIAAPGDRIDALGLDNLESGTVGTSTTLFRDPTNGTMQPDEVQDDYAEKLLVAQAALGSIATRSDFFAAWFIVHGYQKSDTEGLGLNDPLVPSVAKRYLMVIDRSNVLRKGEKPRVVLFTEVPM